MTTSTKKRRRQQNRFEKVWAEYEHVLEAAESSGEYTDHLAICINALHAARASAGRGTSLGWLQTDLLVVTRQQGILTQERWQHLMENFKPDTPEWDGQIAALFFEFFGRQLERRNTKQMALDTETLRAMDTNPYLGAKGKEMMYQYNDSHIRWGRRLKMAHGWKPKRPEPKNDDSSDALHSQSDRFSYSHEDESYGGRYGYLPGTREQAPKPSEKETNPEQIDHVDQMRIDAIAAKLLQDIDL